MKKSEEKYLACGLVPFYYNKFQPNVSRHIEYLKNTIAGLRRAGIVRIVVVNDGSEIPLECNKIKCDKLITLKENSGKTGAVVAGINEILKNPPIDFQYIVQCDYDADQDPEDAKLLMQKFKKISSVEKPSLVIGDRYKTAQPDPLPHRRTILHLQELLCKKIGYDVQDTVSGLRAYTKELAEKFQQMNRSKGFGNDIEQLIVARLLNMKVEAVPLTFSRQRSNATPKYKLSEVMNGILVHEIELEKKGLRSIVDAVSRLQKNLKAGRKQFSLDLLPFGESGSIQFSRLENGYTANIVKKDPSPN